MNRECSPFNGEAFEVFLTSGSPPRSLYSQIGKARLNECPPFFFFFFFGLVWYSGVRSCFDCLQVPCE